RGAGEQGRVQCAKFNPLCPSAPLPLCPSAPLPLCPSAPLPLCSIKRLKLVRNAGLVSRSDYPNLILSKFHLLKEMYLKYE
ncbi:hypothetical protein, partial [Nostoc sp.]|uniref:hypothetical protein n=1 Tax=Nostoc sp. TaxID=1180 RepID=UPI002FF609EF